MYCHCIMSFTVLHAHDEMSSIRLSAILVKELSKKALRGMCLSG